MTKIEFKSVFIDFVLFCGCKVKETKVRLEVAYRLVPNIAGNQFQEAKWGYFETS